MQAVRIPWAHIVTTALVLGAVSLGFTRPVAFDETNFLRLAAGAVVDPWRPHDARINWQGSTERAFAVLSNPPGIAWWLAPVMDWPVWAQRAWMLPWSALAAVGAWWLAARFAPGAAALLLVSPIAALAATSLLPDMPLYACVLAGIGGYIRAVDNKAATWPWALLAGCSVLFRYSGLAILPLLPVYAFLHRRPPAPAAAALLPVLALGLHDLHAYGAVHLLEMGRFQSVSNTPLDVFHKAVATICMLGGAVALPVFGWGGTVLLGALAGGALGVPFGIAGVGFAALGGAAVGALFRRGQRPAADAAFLMMWGVSGLLFLLSLRFTAARYWLPFLAPFVLAAPARGTGLRLVATALLTALLLAEDAAHARAESALATRVAALGRGSFTGHWGWQAVLERAGWTAMDEGAAAPAGALVAIPHESWPQPVQVRCDHVVFEAASAAWPIWLPRGYTAAGHANLHANWIAGSIPIRTVAPWWFGDDPYERARVCQE